MGGIHILGFSLIVVFTLVSCSERQISFDDVARVQERYESELMSHPGVVGLATGLCPDPGGEPCLKVLVEEMTPELKELIPDRLDGVMVEIDVTGAIESQLP